jgi:hypothetical protein
MIKIRLNVPTDGVLAAALAEVRKRLRTSARCWTTRCAASATVHTIRRACADGLQGKKLDVQLIYLQERVEALQAFAEGFP